MTARADLGRFGERLAAEYLAARGYAIRARNVRLPPWGEIDLVAERDGVLVLVEVRTRRGDGPGDALDSLTPAKRRRMLRAARAYLAGLGDDDPPAARIDVIAVRLGRSGKLLGIDHIENAVEGESA